MNKFETSSLEERKQMETIFNKYGIKEYSFTDVKGFDRIDGEFIHPKTGKRVIFEVKNRNVDHNQYPSTVIEESKYNFLKAKAIQEDCEPRLFVFFKDGYFVSYNLLTEATYKTVRRSSRTTAGISAKDLEVIDKQFINFKVHSKQKYN